MKGIIFNELENMVTESFGAEAWETAVRKTPLKTAGGLFIGPKSYPDEDLVALVSTASDLTGKPADELIITFGHYLFPRLLGRYPGAIQPGMNAKTFLQSIDRVIHLEVRKLFPDAILPSFDYEDPAPDQLVMMYKSPRRLCPLVIGLLRGVSDHFNERIDYEKTSCLNDGDSHCRFELTFSPMA